jgi:hypothetical protein
MSRSNLKTDAIRPNPIRTSHSSSWPRHLARRATMNLEHAAWPNEGHAEAIHRDITFERMGQEDLTPWFG